METPFRHAEAILLDVSLRTGVSVALIRSHTRSKNVVQARQLAANRLRHETNLSWLEIGIVLNRKGRYWPSSH